jgi:hypothetical protein
MQALDYPEKHFLVAAIGWLELGNPREAAAELARIQPEQQIHPEVLDVRWLACAALANWVEGLEVARALVQAAPDRAAGWLHQAYALRRVPGGGLQQAWQALLPAFQMFPNEAIIPFNLSCYACQLRELDAARLWLNRARQVGGKEHIDTMALSDPDLEPLWNEIRSGT